MFLFRDKQLVKRILRGEQEAGEEWVREYYDDVYRFLHLMAGSRQTADELAQETFVQAWKSLNGYRGEASLRTWLHRIAHRQWIRWQHSRWRPEALEQEHADASQDFLGELLDSVCLQQALRCLSPEFRDTFVLFHLQELSVKEIAAVLDVKEGTVLSRLHTARTRLKKELSEQDLMTTVFQENPNRGTKLYEMSKTSF